jgi:glycosyltransferase involved in cell wall biosynthesis
MKILMLAEDPNINVARSNVRKRVEAYAELFDELHVIVLTAANFKTDQPVQLHPGGCGGRLFLYSTSGSNPLLRRFRVYARARMLCRHIRFDVISSQGPNEIGFIAYLLARSFDIKLQLQVHTDVLSPWYRASSWKERLRYLLARFLLPRADCIRVVSQRIQQSLVGTLRIPESRISVLPVFQDLEPFYNSPARPSDAGRLKDYRFKMAAVGRFVDKEKNFSMLIKMMAEFVKREPTAVLFLVGDGPDKRNYQKQIIRYGLKKNIIIEPWRIDLASFYGCFDVLLISSWYEGWGLVAMEAMAAGLPVVMTDVGLAREVVQDAYNGRVVPVADRGAFLSACLDMYEHPEKRRAYADMARRTIAGLQPRNREEYLRRYRESFERCSQ